MVDKQLGIDAEQPVKQLLVVQLVGTPQRTAGNIPHGIQAVLLQLFGVAPPHPPKIGQGAVIPQQAAVGLLGQAGNAHPVAVRLDVFGFDIHRHLAEIEVAADAGGSGNAGFLQHLQDHLHGKFPRGKAVAGKIIGGVDEHLIDGIDVDILRRHVTQIDLVDAGAVLQVAGHAGRRHNVIHRQLRRAFQQGSVVGGAGKNASGRALPAYGVDSGDLLHHLEQTWPSRQTAGLQGGRNRKADGFFGTGGVRHHQMGGQRVQPTLHTLHRGKKGFEIDGDIGPLLHGDPLLSGTQ